MEEKVPTRSIIIKSHCGRCNKIHSSEGLGGIFAIFKGTDEKSIKVKSVIASCWSGKEVVALFSSILKLIWKNDKTVFLEGLAEFCRDNEGAFLEVKKIKKKGFVN